jgi:hypothetical protein
VPFVSKKTFEWNVAGVLGEKKESTKDTSKETQKIENDAVNSLHVLVKE